jgi:hypothetical protein
MEKRKKSRRMRAAAVTAVVLAAAVSATLAATGYAAGLVSFSSSSPTADQYPAGKVTICHHTHSAKNPFVTITVSENALPAHLRHGDTIGPCAAAPPAAGVVAATRVHKAHKAKGTNRGMLKRHGKPAKNTQAGKAHGKSMGLTKSHGSHAVAPTTSSTTHGKVHAQTHGQAKTHGQATTHASAKGHGKDHAKTHGHGSGQSHGHNGHGQGTGQGTGTATHGNSGGNGKDHKQ